MKNESTTDKGETMFNKKEIRDVIAANAELNNTEMAELLNSHGYTTKHGKPFRHNHVSYFRVKQTRGLRGRKKATKGAKKREGRRGEEIATVDLVVQVAHSNIPSAARSQIIRALLDNSRGN